VIDRGRLCREHWRGEEREHQDQACHGHSFRGVRRASRNISCRRRGPRSGESYGAGATRAAAASPPSQSEPLLERQDERDAEPVERPRRRTEMLVDLIVECPGRRIELHHEEEPSVRSVEEGMETAGERVQQVRVMRQAP
jgi:hypothetical protein